MALPSTDPATLANNARCFDQCISPGMQLATQTYLLAIIAGVSTSNPSDLANQARCFFSCVPQGEMLAIQNYLLVQLLS